MAKRFSQSAIPPVDELEKRRAKVRAQKDAESKAKTRPKPVAKKGK